MAFGEKLQALRKARGWSQEELADRINVSRQALSKWESGTSVPDTANVVALSRLFGVTTDYLLVEEGTVTAVTPAAAGEKKWPGGRIVWAVLLAVSVAGMLALLIWGAVTEPMTILDADGHFILRKGLPALWMKYKLGWLICMTAILMVTCLIVTTRYHAIKKYLDE